MSASAKWPPARLRRLMRSALAAVRLLPPPGPDYLERQVARSWRKEAQTLADLGVRDGLSILDMGCGPGHFTARLAERLPQARIAALDNDPVMLDAARTLLAAKRNVAVRDAPAHATGLADASCDVVLARLLFQHLRDPAVVAREAYRVLRPAGRLIVTDVDDDLFGVVEPAIPGFRRLLAAFGAEQARRGGNRRIGRALVPILQGAGFGDVALDAIVTTSGEAGIEACLPQLDPAPLAYLVRAGQLSQADADALRDARDAFLRDANPFAMVLLFVASGTKPAG